MRVLHVIGVYPPTRMAGPPSQVHRLMRELRACGVDARVVTTNADGPVVTDVPTGRWIEREGVPVYYGRRLPGTHHGSWGAWRTIVRETGYSDVVHGTGIYSWTTLAVAAAARKAGVPVVVSPRGGLDPKARTYSAVKKAVFFRLGGFRALQEAAAFHVTSPEEQRDVDAFVAGARSVVVPNGVDVPRDDELARWDPASPDTRTVLYLGRVHPIKNVIPLVRAWARVAVSHPAARLVVAGPDDHGHRAEVARVVASERLAGSVTLLDRVEGEEKHRLLTRAWCLILPSANENFGNVVAEGLAHGVPVIASTGTPWSGLRDHACGWWQEPTVEGLTSVLTAALSIDPAARAAMGARGRRWMLEAFAWPQVARGMTDLYDHAVSTRRFPR